MMYEIGKLLVGAGTCVASSTGAKIVLDGVVKTVTNPETLTQAEQVAMKVFQVAAPAAVGAAIAAQVESEMDSFKEIFDKFGKKKAKEETEEKEEVVETVQAKDCDKKIDKKKAIKVKFAAEA